MQGWKQIYKVTWKLTTPKINKKYKTNKTIKIVLQNEITVTTKTIIMNAANWYKRNVKVDMTGWERRSTWNCARD